MRTRPLAFFLLVLLACAGAFSATAEPVAPAAPPSVAWRNPVVARAAGALWGTPTASAVAPGFPLLRSADLVHWTRVGSVFGRPPAWVVGSLWAPELAVGPDGVRLYYTGRRADGRLCVGV